MTLFLMFPIGAVSAGTLAGVDRWAVSQSEMAMDMRAGMIPSKNVYDMSVVYRMLNEIKT